MIEIPEAKVAVKLAHQVLEGRVIHDVEVLNKPFTFCWMNKNPDEITRLVSGQSIKDIKHSGHYVRFLLENDIEIVCAEGTYYRYIKSDELTKKNQLVLIFDNGYALEFKIQLYGFVLVGSLAELLENNKYFKLAYDSVDVLDQAFTFDHFKKVTLYDSKKGSNKQALATKQHIPGLGNGILQDILFDAKIRPETKISDIPEDTYFKVYQSVVSKIDEMCLFGGRDIETNLLGEKGGYLTLMNSKSIKCPMCQSELIHKNYMGGKVIYCPKCQK
ncbi:MAG: hypothetical protein K9L02_05995 [Acholeplasmataceae bacterium]|nr:hypothetical protein [Acholeplasmataceae bacterium]